MNARLVCAFPPCPIDVVVGESHLGQNGKIYCSYGCEARHRFGGPALPGPATVPAAN